MMLICVGRIAIHGHSTFTKDWGVHEDAQSDRLSCVHRSRVPRAFPLAFAQNDMMQQVKVVVIGDGGELRQCIYLLPAAPSDAGQACVSSTHACSDVCVSLVLCQPSARRRCSWRTAIIASQRNMSRQSSTTIPAASSLMAALSHSSSGIRRGRRSMIASDH